MAIIRKDPLVTDECYHVFNKSIARFKIFNGNAEFMRMLNVIRYYQFKNMPYAFSQFIRLPQVEKIGFDCCLSSVADPKDKLVEIISYCLMPTHVHFVLKQLIDDGISIFMGNVLNSYARFFNKKYKRLGPLWAGRFKNVLVESYEQLLHLTRYVHLNPTTAILVEKPEDWAYSSYLEYLKINDRKKSIAYWDNILDILPREYKKFVEDRVGYQRELEEIKHLTLED